MRLHENWDLFSDALQAASQPVEDGGLGIKTIFIEKDYLGSYFVSSLAHSFIFFYLCK